MRRALKLAREIGDEDALAHAIGNLGLALEEDERPDEAEAALRELQELADAENVDDWHAQAATGFGRVAFIRGNYKEAAEHYAAAVAIYGQNNSDKVVYPLGGRLESLGRAGQHDGLQETAAALVDRLRAGADPELIVTYFGRAGMSWLRHGKLEEATSLFGIAALVAAAALGEVGPENDDLTADFRPLAHAIGFLVLAAEDARDIDDELVYDAFVKYVNDHEGDAGDTLRPYIHMMREAMESR